MPTQLHRPATRASRATYTRRRIVAALVVTVLVLTAWALLRELGVASGAPLSAARAGSGPGHPSPAVSLVGVPSDRVHVVQAGETFWSIANKLDPEGDPRPIVDRLVAARGDTRLQAGEVIVLPPSNDN